MTRLAIVTSGSTGNTPEVRVEPVGGCPVVPVAAMASVTGSSAEGGCVISGCTSGSGRNRKTVSR